jgi:hypothetical protein
MKEPGQTAYEVLCSRKEMACAPWSSLFHSSKELWAAVESAIRAENAAKVRAETIEECAKVAESLIVEPTATRDVTAICQELAAAELGANIAAALRALGEKAANPSRPE